jgi:hypothetical protein
MGNPNQSGAAENPRRNQTLREVYVGGMIPGTVWLGCPLLNRPSESFETIALKSGRAHGAALLKAFPAKHRASLCRPERHGGFLSALRTVGLGFRAHLQAASVGVSPAALGASGLAPLTSLGFVLEAFVGEKHLFTGGKYELGAALRTLQDPIVIFHEALPLAQVRRGDGSTFARRPEYVEFPTAWLRLFRGRRGGSQGPANVKPNKTRTLPDWGLILGSAAPSCAVKRILIRFPPLLLA